MAFTESRLMPTRRAATALLTVDAALLLSAVVLPWHYWFAVAYVPLLITVVWGAMLSGWWRHAATSACVVVCGISAALWASLKLGSADQLGIVLVGGQVLLCAVVLVWLALSVGGWYRFFAATKPM